MTTHILHNWIFCICHMLHSPCSDATCTLTPTDGVSDSCLSYSEPQSSFHAQGGWFSVYLHQKPAL